MSNTTDTQKNDEFSKAFTEALQKIEIDNKVIEEKIENMTEEEKEKKKWQVREKIWEEDSPLFFDRIGEKELENSAFQAIQSITYDGTPDEIAKNFKERGNELLEDHGYKKYHKDILQYYGEGLEQKIEDMDLKASLHNNRAYIHLGIGNYGHCIRDCFQVLKIQAQNIKAMYRLVKAASKLHKYDLALEICNEALEIKPNHNLFQKEKKYLEERIEHQKEMEKERKRKEHIQKEIPKKIVQLLNLKGIKVGEPEIASEHLNVISNGYIGNFDKTNPGGLQVDEKTGNLFFVSVFLYDEFSQCDIIQVFSEQDRMIDHLDQFFPPNGEPFPYGSAEAQAKYTLPNIKVFFCIPSQTKEEIYYEIDINMKLGEILKSKEYILPYPFIPIFHIVCNGSPYLDQWKIKQLKKK